MIGFCNGQGAQALASLGQQEAIEGMLKTCACPGSLTNMLNIQFNNAQHFGTGHAPLDIYGYLDDLQHAVVSSKEVVQVMGGVHSGAEHYTQLIGQTDPSGTFQPARVTDSYISIRVSPSSQSKPYKNLIPNSTYHLLVDTPQITWVPLDSEPIVLAY